MFGMGNQIFGELFTTTLQNFFKVSGDDFPSSPEFSP